MTRIIDLLFTQECLNKLEELFYTTFYCNTYIGYDNVLSVLNKSFILSGISGSFFKDSMLQDTKDTYLLVTTNNYTIDDDIMNNIIFHSVLKLFVDIIIISRGNLFENKLKILNRQFIIPITGNINIMNSIQKICDILNHNYGEDVDDQYNYITYIKEELTEYFEFNSQCSILK